LVDEPKRCRDGLEGIGHGGVRGRLALELSESTTNVTQCGLGVWTELGALRTLDVVQRTHGLRDRLGDVRDGVGQVRIGLQGGEAAGKRFTGRTRSRDGIGHVALSSSFGPKSQFAECSVSNATASLRKAHHQRNRLSLALRGIRRSLGGSKTSSVPHRIRFVSARLR
jgi:hypothetical protein